MLLSEVHPILYNLSVIRQRLRRSWQWYFSRSTYASQLHSPLLYRVFKHQSLLLRKLGSSDVRLQHNKIANLKVASPKINGVTIKPGETFSLWKLIGKPTRRKGYLTGMLLANGDVVEGIGGGLCQLSNLIYWMALHTPMQITERYHHGFDAFPDSGRTLPFGSGATIFYNYIDLQFYNPTDQTFQIVVWVDIDHLKGEIRSDQPLANGYHIVEMDHAFVQSKSGTTYRQNRLIAQLYNLKTGVVFAEKEICENRCPVKYEVSVAILSAD